MTVLDSSGGDAEHAHPAHLAHHWDNSQQQFEAGKLGMWLFLGTEFLLFGGLFCAYAVFRFSHPELFEYGSQFLDRKWGAINTIVLILSSLTMATAVSAAQLGKTRALVVLLSLTFLGGVGFMSIKFVEYSHKFQENIVWGTGFYEEPAHAADAAHGAGGARAETVEAAMVAESTSSAALGDAAPIGEEVDGLLLPVSAVPLAAAGPTGLAVEVVEHKEESLAEIAVHHSRDPDRPPNAHIFFGIYFAMTGLHGLHVLAGMGVIAWLIVRAVKGHFSPAYFTPVDLGGLYWHVVDLIWIFLFPLLYLIA